MVDLKNNNLTQTSIRKITNTRRVIFILEISLVALLLFSWLASDSIQNSKSLWILFFYSFPAGFIIGTVPHEPVFLYFSKFYSPIVVTLVSVSGTALIEAINYSVFKFVTDLRSFQKIKYSGFLEKLIEKFNKAPFLVLLVAGFTPIPFYPFRFLVVLAHYPAYKYVLAVFISRASRYYLLALFGHLFKIPDSILVIIFIMLVFVAIAPVLKKLFIKKKQVIISSEDLCGELETSHQADLTLWDEASSTGEAI
jgi:membrane protein YqaA with SNARE-associated domain